MSTRLTSLSATLALGLASFGAHAAPPAEPAGALPPPVVAAPPDASAQAQVTVEGKVQRMLTNPYGEVDGLRLANGTITKFPPHLADALTRVVKVGDTVRVIGRAESPGTVKADAIVHTGTGQTVYDQPVKIGEARPVPPHLRAERLQPQKVEGRVDAVLTGPRGEAHGVILSDGSIVRFPPDSLRAPLQPGAAFAASGMGTRNAFGTSLEAVSVGTSLAALQPLHEPAMRPAPNGPLR